jgi:mannose-6-phosphate isomerase-like protein (cupin superfamily)
MNDLLGKTIENPIIGDIVTYVHTANETNGEKTVLELKLFPGGGNGLHFHTAFDESFELIEGSLNVQVGNRKTKMAVGDKITAGKNEPYRFFADSDKSGTFKITLVPGHAGFENALAIGYGLARDGETNKKGIPKFKYLPVLVTLSDTNMPGIFSMLGKYFARRANKPKSIKLQEDLMKKYCQ